MYAIDSSIDSILRTNTKSTSHTVRHISTITIKSFDGPPRTTQQSNIIKLYEFITPTSFDLGAITPSSKKHTSWRV